VRAAKLKSDMLVAISKKLTAVAHDPDSVDLVIQSDNKALIYRRPAEKKRTVKSSAVDLTA